MPNYYSDGSGRDQYIGYNNGGLSMNPVTQFRKSKGAKRTPGKKPRAHDFNRSTWTSTNRADFQWPAMQKPKGPMMPKKKLNFSIPRNKEFVYPNGTLFQYHDLISTPATNMRRTQPLPAIKTAKNARQASMARTQPLPRKPSSKPQHNPRRAMQA